MVPKTTQLSNDTMKSCLTKTLKYGACINISNANNNNTNIFNVYTPTTNTAKVNIKNQMLAKK